MKKLTINVTVALAAAVVITAPLTVNAGLFEVCETYDSDGWVLTPCNTYGDGQCNNVCSQTQTLGFASCVSALSICETIFHGTYTIIIQDSSCDADCGCLNNWGPPTISTGQNEC